MQRNENITIDARSFPEIWKGLTVPEKEDLTLRIYNSGACRTRQSIWMWATGRTVPSTPIAQNAVAKCVQRVTGARVSSDTLFPR